MPDQDLCLPRRPARTAAREEHARKPNTRPLRVHTVAEDLPNGDNDWLTDIAVLHRPGQDPVVSIRTRQGDRRGAFVIVRQESFEHIERAMRVVRAKTAGGSQ